MLYDKQGGTGILFEEPNPTGSRPRDLIGLYRRCHDGNQGKGDPNRRKGAAGKVIWHIDLRSGAYLIPLLLRRNGGTQWFPFALT